MTLLESLNNFGFGFNNVSQLINYFRYSTFIIICVIEIFVFFVLGIYLDQVWPTEIGVKKHPLFCFGVDHSKANNSNSITIKIDEEYERNNYEASLQT
jgi:hypothetical protein